MENLYPKLRENSFGLVLTVCVFFVRMLCSGPAFHADGPAHIRAIISHTYVIQPPGYWLFNHIGGLIANIVSPTTALSLINWVCSSLGCAVMYLCARRIAPRPLAELGTILYSVVFFAWFSGDIQSTYATQLLFGPLTFYLMLCYEGEPNLSWLLAVALSYSLGAGLRPSDGIFLGPLLMYFTSKIGRKHQIILLGSVCALCLAWLIPSQIAIHRYVNYSTGEQISSVARGAILLGRVNIYTISGIVRLLLTLGTAFGPCLLFLPYARKGHLIWLLFWASPALCFFTFLYFSDALYLDCIVAPSVLICLMGMKQHGRPRLAIAALIVAILINLAVFLCFKPLPSSSLVGLAVDKYYGDFTLYALKNQYWIRSFR